MIRKFSGGKFPHHENVKIMKLVDPSMRAPSGNLLEGPLSDLARVVSACDPFVLSIY
jgi:hypothetical protein